MPKIMKSPKKIFLFSILTIFIVFCTIMAVLISNILVKTDQSSENVNSNSFTLYMISLSKSKVEKESISRASDFQKIGAGGFVWYQDEYYHVITSAYLEKNDAILVQNSIKINQNLESEIITVSFPSIIINGTFNNDEKKVLIKALNSVYQYYNEIYDISISLDTGVYNEISARLAVNNVHHNLNNIIDDYETMFINKNEILTNLKNMLNECLMVSQNLCSGVLISSNQTYSSLLKYRYLEILNIYNNFTQNYFV